MYVSDATRVLKCPLPTDLCDSGSGVHNLNNLFFGIFLQPVLKVKIKTQLSWDGIVPYPLRKQQR